MPQEQYCLGRRPLFKAHTVPDGVKKTPVGLERDSQTVQASPC